MGVLYKHRRFAGMIALVGVALYAALAPMHVVSQASAATAADAALLDLGLEQVRFDCHSGAASETSDPENSAPEKKCPFCKGYASFLTAFAGGSDTAMIDAERASPIFSSLGTALIHVDTKTPQNRGPPIEL